MSIKCYIMSVWNVKISGVVVVLWKADCVGGSSHMQWGFAFSYCSAFLLPGKTDNLATTEIDWSWSWRGNFHTSVPHGNKRAQFWELYLSTLQTQVFTMLTILLATKLKWDCRKCHVQPLDCIATSIWLHMHTLSECWTSISRPMGSKILL